MTGLRFMTRSIAFAALFVAWSATAVDPLVLDLWPGKVPNESGAIGPERVRMSPQLDRKQVEVTEPTRMITAVTNPTAQALYERHGWRRDTAFLHYEYELPRESL